MLEDDIRRRDKMIARMQTALLWISNMAVDESEASLERQSSMLAKAGRRARSALSSPATETPDASNAASTEEST